MDCLCVSQFVCASCTKIISYPAKMLANFQAVTTITSEYNMSESCMIVWHNIHMCDIVDNMLCATLVVAHFVNWSH